MMNRINKKFNELKEKNKKALITYITAGFPSIDKTEELIYAQERGGASIIEIGIPYSDPVADGAVIQRAGDIALKGGTNLEKIFNLVERVRKNTHIPLLFLLYYNTVFVYGIEKFIDRCEEVGIDGLIIPDLPLEEQEEIQPHIEGKSVALIPLVAPTSKQRIKKVVENKSGFVYCVSSLGVTGRGGEFHSEIEGFLNEVRACTDLPIAVGFGISKKEHIDKLKDYVDGVIVGSAIVSVVEESNGCPEALEAFVKGLSFQ
jgi:tryptophan synthase alpha chain